MGQSFSRALACRYGTIKRWKCMQQGPTCLRVGFLPYDLFPRHGDWPRLAAKAMIYHMTLGCVQARTHAARTRHGPSVITTRASSWSRQK